MTKADSGRRPSKTARMQAALIALGELVAKLPPHVVLSDAEEPRNRFLAAVEELKE